MQVYDSLIAFFFLILVLQHFLGYCFMAFIEGQENYRTGRGSFHFLLHSFPLQLLLCIFFPFFFLLILFFPTSSPLLFSHLPFLPPHTYTYNYTSTLSFMFLPLQLLLSNFSLSSSSDHLTPSCFLMYLSCPCMPPPSSLLHFLFNYSCPSFPVFFFLLIFLILFLLLLHSPLVLFPAPYDSHHALYVLHASPPCVLVPVFFTGFRNIKKH